MLTQKINSLKKCSRNKLRIVSIATWNIQGGAGTPSKFDLVLRDMVRWKVDILCMQEVQAGEDWDFEKGDRIIGGYKFYLFKKQEGTGLGFVVGPRVKYGILATGVVSSRIATLVLQVGSGSAQLSIINVHAPTEV